VTALYISNWRRRNGGREGGRKISKEQREKQEGKFNMKREREAVRKVEGREGESKTEKGSLIKKSEKDEENWYRKETMKRKRLKMVAER
jgi:hypothetical protein